MSKTVRVLVVDDEPAVCHSCTKTLTAEGYQVDQALNGEEALRKIAAENYDLVVTDLKMPKVDGMQLLRQVKRRWPEVNVIMITGYGTIRSAVEAMKLGAFDYLSKPFTAEELAGSAARALGLTHLHREDRTQAVYYPIAFTDLKEEHLKRMWCIPEHAWVRVRQKGEATVGIDAVYLRLLEGELQAIDLPQVGAVVNQGESCACMHVTLTAPGSSPRRFSHNLWSPLSGRVRAVNSDLAADLRLLARSPYVRGWIARLAPANLTEDLKNLKPFTESIAGRAALKHVTTASPR